MAIIYSYPKVNTLKNSDLLIGTRFENEGGGNSRSISFTMEALAGYVSSIYSLDLDQVLENGNESLLDAKIGELYLYDGTDTDYGKVSLSDSGFEFFNAAGTLLYRLEPGLLTISSGGVSYGILADGATGGRTYELPNKSGTFAMTSDIVSTTNYGLATQIAKSTPITNTTTETSLIGTTVGTLSVPANSFAVGDSFSASLMGHINCLSSATLRIKIKTATGVILADTGAVSLNAATAKHWKLDINFTIREIGGAGVAAIASGGAFSYNRDGSNNPEAVTFVSIEEETFNTTIANTLQVTAQWNNASTSNTIYSDIFTLNKIY